MEYDPTQFVGTAQHYLRGRPPYSAHLPDLLAREAGLDGRGHLVDVGCGPGTLGVQLAALAERRTLVDPDPGMVAEATAYAAAQGLRATTDVVRATAEELGGLALAPARLVTFGQSFHRVDREVVLDAVHDLLEPGGWLALVTHDATRPPAAPPPGHPPVPHEEIGAVIDRFLGPVRRSGARPASAYRAERFEDTLRRSRFAPPRVVHAAGRTDVVRDVDGVVAGVLSTSFASPHLLGEHLEEFVQALRAALAARTPTGSFWDWPGDTEVVLAQRVRS